MWRDTLYIGYKGDNDNNDDDDDDDDGERSNQSYTIQSHTIQNAHEMSMIILCIFIKISIYKRLL